MQGFQFVVEGQDPGVRIGEFLVDARHVLLLRVAPASRARISSWFWRCNSPNGSADGSAASRSTAAWSCGAERHGAPAGKALRSVITVAPGRVSDLHGVHQTLRSAQSDAQPVGRRRCPTGGMPGPWSRTVMTKLCPPRPWRPAALAGARLHGKLDPARPWRSRRRCGRSPTRRWRSGSGPACRNRTPGPVAGRAGGRAPRRAPTRMSSVSSRRARRSWCGSG